MPQCVGFGPEEHPEGTVEMTLDEFETIRLIDLEKITQQECAQRMNVARTTVQSIYDSARYKLALSLVDEKKLVIKGGNYMLCNGAAPGCSDPCCRRAERGNNNMKIAVTYENGQIFQHFGHTEQFKLYDVQDGKIISSCVVDTNGSGHGALAGFLADHGADTLICGGIGGGARNALAQAGISLYGGASGNADAAVNALISGKLEYDPDVMCAGHEEHSGNCGGENCQGGNCGR